ncbi:MAG: hypothetical protein U0165_01565 [Polyangiaceae bacterium]
MAAPTIQDDLFTTRIRITLPIPAGNKLSLSKQESDGFFSRLFRGQDIQVGDPSFDSAFIVKGEPEAFVRSVLTATARGRLMTLLSGGAAISLDNGALDVWAPAFTATAAQLDALLKAAFGAAEAIG